MEAGGLKVNAAAVHEILSRYMAEERMDVVVDFEKSSGTRLYDAKRQEWFLDFFSFYSTCPVGYNHPRLRKPARIEELGRLAIHKPSNSDVDSREMAEFVETFARLAKPDFMKYMFFIEGGALAVENALKVAFDWKTHKNLARGFKTERGAKVIHLREAFHGRSGYTLSLTNTSDLRKIRSFPKFDWPRIVNPKCTFPLQGKNLRQVQKLEKEALEQIRKVLSTDGDDVACLILEPIQGEGGDNHFRPHFHRQLRRVCDKNEILLIYDEVQTGLGPTGKMWAFEHFVKPDILAFGKKTQVCGILVSERVDEVAEHVFRVPGRLNSTWGGNLIDMVRCRLYLEIYQEENLLEHCRRVGALLLEELRQLQKEFPTTVSNSRGLGLFCAFDLPDSETRSRFRQKLFERRLLILPCGQRSIRFRTALNIPEQDIYRGIEIMRDALREM